jgi:tellurite resistance protein TerC
MFLILIYTGYKMLTKKKVIEPEKNPLIKIIRKIIPVTNEYHGGDFMKQNGKLFATLCF